MHSDILHWRFGSRYDTLKLPIESLSGEKSGEQEGVFVTLFILTRKLGNYLITVQFKLANTGIIESNGIKSYESIDVSEAIPSGYSLAFALGGYTGDNQFHFFGLFVNPIKNTITAYIGNSSNTADSGDPIVILVCLKK